MSLDYVALVILIKVYICTTKHPKVDATKGEDQFKLKLSIRYTKKVHIMQSGFWRSGEVENPIANLKKVIFESSLVVCVLKLKYYNFLLKMLQTAWSIVVLYLVFLLLRKRGFLLGNLFSPPLTGFLFSPFSAFSPFLLFLILDIRLGSNTSVTILHLTYSNHRT